MVKKERERNRKNRGWIQLFFEMILDDKNEFLRYNLHTTTSINELRFLGNCAELECGREREREREVELWMEHARRSVKDGRNLEESKNISSSTSLYISFSLFLSPRVCSSTIDRVFVCMDMKGV